MTDEPTPDASSQPTLATSSPNSQGQAGGPSPALVGGLALLLVLAVGMVALFVLGIGPFARSTPTPTPGPIAQPTPTMPLASTSPGSTATPARTTTPAASSTASAGPTATPIPSGDVTDQLLSHIPYALHDTCTVRAGRAPIVAQAECTADGGDIEVKYFQYDGYDSMFAQYESYLEASQIEPDSGDCRDPASWPTENGFNIAGQLAGRWLCTEALGATTIYWTDNRLNILSQATQTKSDIARLVEFWVHESGPNLLPDG